MMIGGGAETGFPARGCASARSVQSLRDLVHPPPLPTKELKKRHFDLFLE
jgi:hypothetical protein